MDTIGETPVISVVVSLVDHRDEAMACLDALVHRQNAPPHSYEVIVVSDGSEAEIDRALREKLRERDRFLVEPTRNEYRLFNVGSKLARGEVLLVIESHCIAEPEFVSAFLEAFENPAVKALRCETIGLAEGKLEEYEREVFEESFFRGLRDTAWNRVLIHGFAIRLSIFREMGGFRERSENFGPWELGVRLHNSGISIDCLSTARVKHRYMGNRDKLRDFVVRFSRAEWEYWCNGDRELRNTYLPALPGWLEQRKGGMVAAKSLLVNRRGIRVLRQAKSVQEKSVFRAVIRNAKNRMFPRHDAQERILRESGDQAWEHARRTETREAFLEFWRSCIRLGRFRGFRENESVIPQALTLNETVAANQFSPRSLYGWYDSEADEAGNSFSWTEPMAGIHARFPRGPKRVLVEVATDVPRATDCRMVLGDEITWAQIHSMDPMVLEFRVPDHCPHEGWLTLVCPGMKDKNSDRILGMSIRSVTLSG